MASSYPGGYDALANPAASDSLASPSHSAQHANANDAIEAIQSELGLDPAGASATVRARLDALDTTVAAKAPSASPTFTGTVTTPLTTAGYVKTSAGGVLSSAAAIAQADVTNLTSDLAAKFSTPGAWTNYTPTWTATGGTPTIGNGTLTGRYQQIGKVVHFTLALFVGSTTNMGTTTAWTFTLPVTSASVITTFTAIVRNANTGAVYRASAYKEPTTTFQVFATDSATPVGYNSPGTWAANWYLYVNGTYEAA